MSRYHREAARSSLRSAPRARRGGPAEQAGLQKGDVIIEIAGQTIANIYDYTYALELLKIGEPVKVVYMRGSERRETTLTPAARR